MISNLICRSLDKSLASLARAEHCYYSRYADDLCFSTRRHEFPGSLAVVDDQGIAQPGTAIRDVIAENGFRIQLSKTRLLRRTQRQRVTGLVVNEGVNVDRRYVWGLRNVLYIWQRYGIDAAVEAFYRANPRLNWPPKKADPKFDQVIRGRVQHVGSVKGWNSPVYRRLAASLRTLDSTFAPSTIRELQRKVAVRIYTEGETDFLHLQAAKQYFEALGEFMNMTFEFPQRKGAGGSSELWTVCKGLSVSGPPLMCLCVFDRDETKMLGRAVGGGDMKEHGPNVAAIAIKPPEWRDEADPLSIELLYTDEDLKRKDSAGRRLYLRSEFDDKGRHESEPVYILTPKARELIREEVLAVKDGSPVGLAKTAFAKNVHDVSPGFAGVDFGGFRPTFTLIEEAVARFSAEA
jgi:RNA-directed DNA polymerase